MTGPVCHAWMLPPFKTSWTNTLKSWIKSHFDKFEKKSRGTYTNVWQFQTPALNRYPDHLLLDSAPNLGPLISRWVINKFENCWYKSVWILEVLKLLFQQFLNLLSSQQDMSVPILGDLSNNRWSVRYLQKYFLAERFVFGDDDGRNS